MLNVQAEKSWIEKMSSMEKHVNTKNKTGLPNNSGSKRTGFFFGNFHCRSPYINKIKKFKLLTQIMK